MKYRYLSTAVLIVILVNTAFSQLYQDWKWLHPSPQGNELRWVKMWNANTIYAIGGKGTFLKTTDGGASWIFQHSAGRISGIPIQRANLLDAWFFNQNTGIVVGSYGSIFRTTDGGVTFDSVPGNPSPLNLNLTGIHFINELTGYVIGQLTNYRLMKTTDGGLHWNAGYGSAPPYSNPYEVYAFNENKIIVLNQLGDVCITTNGGYLWNTYPSGTLVNLYKLVFTDASTGYLSGDWGRCRYTTDGGYSWSNIAGTLPQNVYHFFDLNYANNTIFLTGNSKSMYYSSNTGATWDSISFIAPQSQLPWSDSYYASDVSANGDTLITVGAHGSIHQLQGINNKVTLSQYLKKGSLRDIWASESSGLVIAAGGPSVLSSSLITQDQILRSTDDGQHWSVIAPSTTSSADFYSIEMINDNTGFICGSRSAVYKTTNGGLNWDSLVIPNTPANLIFSAVDFVNSQTGWIFSRVSTGNDSTIYKTTDGGSSWFRQKLGANTGNANNIYAACMLDENSGWVLNNKPRPWKTTDGGYTWDSTGLSDNYLAGLLYGIKMVDALTGYCCGSNNRVYRTTNGGATPWISTGYSSTTVITLYTLETANADECAVMGTYGTSYYTSNGGANWINRNLNSSIDDINGSYRSPDNKLYSVTLLNAGVYRNTAMFITGISKKEELIPDRFVLHQNYPNPFNPETRIRFELPASGKVKLAVYDILGREITVLVNQVLKNGVYEADWDASSYPSGIYFCKITADNFTETIRMVLLK